MDFFEKAKTVRLRSHRGKYLWADDDECVVSLSRDGMRQNAKWKVEHAEDDRLIRLKSCYDCYLTATDVQFLLGMTGKKVLQMKPLCLDSSVEWEPIRDGFSVKLKTRYGNYLRANGSVPPWRNSVTHDIPHRSLTQDWILWEVDMVEIVEDSSQEEIETHSPILPIKPDGRTIYYTVGDEETSVREDTKWSHFLFKGHNLQVLTRRLKEEIGLEEDIIVCSYSHINDKLYPLRLQLPPNNSDMHLVILKTSSKLARTLSEPSNGMICDERKRFDQASSCNHRI